MNVALVRLSAMASFATVAMTVSAPVALAQAREAAVRTPEVHAFPNAPVPTPTAMDYRIGPDDVLDVFYWHDKDLSAQVVVRPDGYISLPLLHDVQALGLTPEALGDRIGALASTYLEDPNVTVVVKQINSRKAFITGEVVRPGPYPLSGPTTVLQLIAMAGGLTAFANQDQVAIIRTGSDSPVTFTFNYKKASQLKNLKDNIVLLPGDTIVVP